MLSSASQRKHISCTTTRDVSSSSQPHAPSFPSPHSNCCLRRGREKEKNTKEPLEQSPGARIHRWRPPIDGAYYRQCIINGGWRGGGDGGQGPRQPLTLPDSRCMFGGHKSWQTRTSGSQRLRIVRPQKRFNFVSDVSHSTWNQRASRDSNAESCNYHVTELELLVFARMAGILKIECEFLLSFYRAKNVASKSSI